MGSRTFDGVWFTIYSHDHPPPHVHGRCNGVMVIVEFIEGKAVLSNRHRAIVPRNAKRSDVQRILRVAAKHAPELIAIWERTHE